jgi:hypothetical protein
MRDASGLRVWILWLAVLSGAALASCAMRPVPSGNNSNSLATPTDAANGQPPCSVFAVKICQDNARDRPSLFYPDAVKGRSPDNPSNLVAFAAQLQIPAGPQLRIACYYRPGTMAVVYARAWALVAGDQLIDLNSQPGQVLNSPGAPTTPPLNDRDYRYLRDRGYCTPPQ